MPMRDLMLVQIVAGIAAKIWAASGAAIITCVIVYFFYGTFTALGLFTATIFCEYFFNTFINNHKNKQ